MRKREGQSGNDRRGSARGERDIRARGSRTKRMGERGKAGREKVGRKP